MKCATKATTRTAKKAARWCCPHPPLVFMYHMRTVPSVWCKSFKLNSKLFLLSNLIFGFDARFFWAWLAHLFYLITIFIYLIIIFTPALRANNHLPLNFWMCSLWIWSIEFESCSKFSWLFCTEVLLFSWLFAAIFSTCHCSGSLQLSLLFAIVLVLGCYLKFLSFKILSG